MTHIQMSERPVSHRALRPFPPLSQRPMNDGPARFVDSANGHDEQAGTKDRPWRTLGHAMTQLQPGQTLYLREGVYFENVYCAIAGTPQQPITIRSYPGERAVLQGGFPEFYNSPSTAWEPYTGPGAAAGEFRSAKPYPNIRDVVGSFGDSMVGLQTYWYAADLRADNELWIADPAKEAMVLPVYCGPGIWYDKATGYIHARLAHTHVNNAQVANYRGVVDPRQVPLVIAPFASTPLFVDQAMHIRFEDLIICGGGYNTVVLQFGVDLVLDGVIVYGGTYCMRARNTGPLKMTNSALYGQIPPWAARSENSLYSLYYRPFVDRPELDHPNTRNIARLPTHAVLSMEGYEEDRVFAFPLNHSWEVSYCEFTNAHDGVYFSGRNMRFHHNLVDHFQDDAIYLSSPTPGTTDYVHVYQNLITRSMMAFGYHNRGGPDGKIFIYRNVVDMRAPNLFDRPSPQKPEGHMRVLCVHLIHAYELHGIESLHYYQNTFVCHCLPDAYAHRTLINTSPRTRRWVFNNLFVYLAGENRIQHLHGFRDVEKQDPRTDHQILIDGSLHWSASAEAVDLPALQAFLQEARQHPASEYNKKDYPQGWEACSLVADPQFEHFDPDIESANDYRLRATSSARNAGIVLPEELVDPFRPRDGERPDIGALPFGSEPLSVGIHGRYKMPFNGCITPD